MPDAYESKGPKHVLRVKGGKKSPRRTGRVGGIEAESMKDRVERVKRKVEEKRGRA